MPALIFKQFSLSLPEPWEQLELADGVPALAAVRPDSGDHGFFTNVVIEEVADGGASLLVLSDVDAQRLPSWHVLDYVNLAPSRERLVATWLGAVPIAVFQELRHSGSAAARVTYSCAVTWLASEVDDSERVLASLVADGEPS